MQEKKVFIKICLVKCDIVTGLIKSEYAFMHGWIWVHFPSSHGWIVGREKLCYKQKGVLSEQKAYVRSSQNDAAENDKTTALLFHEDSCGIKRNQMGSISFLIMADVF